ncbi:hypothetical protein [Polynucleobacter sp. MWH-UH35A]|uniref:hypothetical protein n=1 Tax=Polynucleobacter sp. MWH-UH35A TaxID=1855619 RepID=UPI001BFD2F90|nr:hypothetical protein [Polynucleobacter sp. MWH-UH35A]QWD59690.1 hypothetical protein ICV36_07755 [Polynucleobacter sp. MWH-UH35A]
MLDSQYFSAAHATPYYQDEFFNIWKFPTTKGKKKQEKPIILNYSIMTRAYGTICNRDNFVEYFNHEGFDVYLMDWGKDSLFTLSGWGVDKICDELRDKAVLPLLKEYKTDSLNIFGICIGGMLAAHMINKNMQDDPKFAKKFNKIAFYGSPILGARDLGIAKTFLTFYKQMKPFRKSMHETGISLFTLDAYLLQGISKSLLEWSWNQFAEEGSKTLSEMVGLTLKDRWVPFAAFMDLLEEAFEKTQVEDGNGFHFKGNVKNIHFYNMVGDSDVLVMPSASIVEYGSTVPQQFASFEQDIFVGGHFIFAQPGFQKEKKRLAEWFSA